MKRILIIAAAAAALIAAGCGESQQFTEDFNEAQKPLETLLSDVQSSSGAPDAAKMDKLAQGLDDTADKIGALDAPDDAKDELDTFVKEVHASADNMRDVAKSVEGGKPEEMTAALGKLSESMSKVGSAQTALQTAIN
jgi:methyl-accepting chemotaxis protein